MVMSDVLARTKFRVAAGFLANPWSFPSHLVKKVQLCTALYNRLSSEFVALWRPARLCGQVEPAPWRSRFA